MDFIAVRKLHAEPGKVWNKIAAGKDVVLTRNGEPFAILTPTQPSEVEASLRTLRAARFGNALERMQRHAARMGLDKMTLEEINAEIAAVRSKRSEREAGGH